MIRILLLAALAFCLAKAPVQADIALTDITGRSVTLPAPAKRIVLGEGRHLSVLGMLHDDPVSLVTGWRQDKALDPITLAAWRARFPALDGITAVGSGNRTLSVETVIALEPDLVILAQVDATAPQMSLALEQMAAAGIPVIFVDFFVKPLDNTLPSLRLIARAIGRDARAEAFATLYTSHLDRVLTRLADLPESEQPRVFIQVHATPGDCCATVGAGVFDDFIRAAGGRNIGRDMVAGVMGNPGLETLIASDPDVYLASGGAHLAARGGLVLGPGVSAADAAADMAALTAEPGVADLRAIAEGRAIGIWHLFNDNPLHVVLIEYLARAFHPDRFADLDPLATLAAFEAEFAPVPVPGTWWTKAE